METVQFISDSAASALVQIHRQLGPDAVVFSVRRLPAQGVARLWQRNGRIEVLAGVPDKNPPSRPAVRRDPVKPAPRVTAKAGGDASSARRWQSVAWMEAMGLSPANVDRLQQRLRTQFPG